MAHWGYKIVFISFLITFANLSNAQQPFLKYKPIPTNVDSFDIILGVAPFKLTSSKLNLSAEMRLFRNMTFKVLPSYKRRNNPFLINVDNLEISDPSDLKLFEEQACHFILKRYKSNKNSRVFFGTYLGLGFYANRTKLIMTTQVLGFEKTDFHFRTSTKSLVMVLGNTKLFGKRIIFDYNVSIRYQYKEEKIGNFRINGNDNKSGWNGAFGFTISMPILRK